jgi:hypothetical protein
MLAHFEKNRLRNADVPADMLGDAYLYLIKMFAEGASKKGGEFYTPRSIVRLMVEILDPRPGMSVYDPTCGSAGMLLEAVQYLKDKGDGVDRLCAQGWRVLVAGATPRHRHGAMTYLVRNGGPVIELVSRWLLPMMQDWWDSSS